MTDHSLSYSEKDGCLIFSLQGPLNYISCTVLESQKLYFVEKAVEDKVKAIIIDFSAVGYVDSAGISVLLQYYAVCKDLNIPLALISMNSIVYKVFRITNLNRLFLITKTYSEAIESINQ